MIKLISLCLFLLLTACGSTGNTFNYEKYQKDIDAYDLEEVDQEPDIKGGWIEMAKRVEYPEEARKKGAQGRVLIGFIVDKNGDPYNFEVIESVGYGCDVEVLNALSSITFNPAIKDGKAVDVQFYAPFTFQLPQLAE